MLASPLGIQLQLFKEYFHGQRSDTRKPRNKKTQAAQKTHDAGIASWWLTGQGRFANIRRQEKVTLSAPMLVCM